MSILILDGEARAIDLAKTSQIELLPPGKAIIAIEGGDTVIIQIPDGYTDRDIIYGWADSSRSSSYPLTVLEMAKIGRDHFQQRIFDEER